MEFDLRIDLNGVDVRRKFLILVCELGMLFESDEIEIDNIFLEVCREVLMVEVFFEELEKVDFYFEEMIEGVIDVGNWLWMIVKLEDGKVEIGL